MLRSTPKASTDLAVIGHRGVRAIMPENTLAGFRRAQEVGADGIELDVRVSKDGIPVIMHDDDITETTNGQGRVRDLTLAELQAVELDDGLGIPTLKEALDCNDLTVQVEIKDPNDVSAIAEEISRRGDLHRFVLTSSVPDVLRLIRETPYDATPVGWIPRFLDSEAIRVAKKFDATWLYPGIEGSHKSAVDEAHAAGMTVHMWMINDLPTLRRAIELGVDGVTSDDPGAVVSMLQGLSGGAQ